MTFLSDSTKKPPVAVMDICIVIFNKVIFDKLPILLLQLNWMPFPSIMDNKGKYQPSVYKEAP
jgi:hypothetical protein